MWVGQYDLLLRFANCEQPCKIRATQPVLVCEKCTPKWTDPALPIVGRTSEMCIICLHVCAYAHSDALCANFELCAEGTTCVNCSHARPQATFAVEERSLDKHGNLFLSID